ncbi:hypothetical protein JYU34_006276 [Plutella xylostella]|uniref:Uncharacterized protein n=1 Tax=Plutella xylostella TaxID=51655 RepID=A0ABQ7QRQ9_PLUXY|nr:hypothetical protein JYU34_006276 [Plutella xylostella]
MGVVCLSIYGSVYLSLSTWLRYQSSPTIISMDRDMFAWNTTFPCVTICPDNKIDQRKLRAFVEDYDESEREKLEAFIIALANTTYENLDLLPEFDGLRPSQYMDTLLKLTPSFTPTLTIGAAGIHLNIEPTITEMGLCYAVNSKVAIYNSPAYV